MPTQDEKNIANMKHVTISCFIYKIFYMKISAVAAVKGHRRSEVWCFVTIDFHF